MAAIFGFAGIAGLMAAHAQETTPLGLTTTTNFGIVSPELAAELKAVEQLPTVAPDTLPDGGRGGTYYSAQCPFWPPLPGNVSDLPVWNLGDGYYLINDLSVDYTLPETIAGSGTLTLASSSATVKPMGGGFSPLYQNQNGVPYLTIAPTATNGVQLITIWNNQGPANYDLWWTPALANPDYPWQWIAVGSPGQTNFIVTMTYPTSFYLAIQDTNAIPLWESANPTNQSLGILSVLIDSPTNGSTLLQ